MKFPSLLSVLACICMSVASPSQAQTGGAAAASITTRQAVVEDPGHKPIPVVIWAPATGARLPLVVISHGTGAAPLSHIDTARALAEAGFVVVAPMHPGDNFQDDSVVGKPA